MCIIFGQPVVFSLLLLSTCSFLVDSWKLSFPFLSDSWGRNFNSPFLFVQSALFLWIPANYRFLILGFLSQGLQQPVAISPICSFLWIPANYRFLILGFLSQGLQLRGILLVSKMPPKKLTVQTIVFLLWSPLVSLAIYLPYVMPSCFLRVRD